MYEKLKNQLINRLSLSQEQRVRKLLGREERGDRKPLGFAASNGNTVQYEISAVYHPQPRILSSESGTLVQYVGDNGDINAHTLDGNNTLHVMAMIKIVTPKDAALYDERIQKFTSKSCAKELATISHVSLLAYEKPIVPGYNKKF
ncbi:uncharacterized protein TNIN_441481 [Trichonephila inaurata madagascariensis]|uniref:Uncharacterized protein n=1 Tax=Trichonephila inaurata madagascariensis TaxID=2747483 RepID=A0A8X6XIK6_9ARAC|nr:uncharacterized protein TNIN_441481 [Trichonephila inaurata madagascariensis]